MRPEELRELGLYEELKEFSHIPTPPEVFVPGLNPLIFQLFFWFFFLVVGCVVVLGNVL